MNSDRTDEELGFQIGYDRAKYGVCREDLDALGERAVRDALNSGKWGFAGLPPFEFVSAWLKDAEFVRLEAASAKRDAREEATLAIAKDALSVANEANRIASLDLAAARDSASSARKQARWAMWAAIIATVAAIVATFKA